MTTFSSKASELVLAPNGTPYHTHLGSEQLADHVLLVGDPQRVDMFRQIFDKVDYESENREIHVLCGTFHGNRFSVVSTGMGCDNIDIVLTELDVAANVDTATGTPYPTHRTLRMVRIGTCGSLHANLPCGSAVASAYAVGLDGLLNYYQHAETGFVPDLEEAFCQQVSTGERMARPYAVKASSALLRQVAHDMPQGITVTAPGFYAPQGRRIRITPALSHLNEQLSTFQWNGLRVNNLEMETSGIYGMCQMLGHEALTVCMVVANRATGQFLNHYETEMRDLLQRVMLRLINE